MLNLNIKIEKKADIKVVPPPITGWEGPIGWWRVTTEGDDEGRSEKDIGEFYGHVAEIALSLAKKACYKLYFDPVLNKKTPKKRPVYTVLEGATVHVSGIARPTVNFNDDQILKYMETWLDCDAIHVAPSNLYKSVIISLKD